MRNARNRLNRGVEKAIFDSLYFHIFFGHQGIGHGGADLSVLSEGAAARPGRPLFEVGGASFG